MKIDFSNAEFQKDFLCGVYAFLAFSLQETGNDPSQASTKFQEMMGPIIGNRNPEMFPFSQAMPFLYEKVIKYCNDNLQKDEK